MASPGVDLVDAAAAAWADGAAALHGALVYLDEGAAAAAAAAGLPLLLGLGAAGVCDLRAPRAAVRACGGAGGSARGSR